MKQKILVSLIILLVSVLLVVSGILAFFTDHAKVNYPKFLTGTVKIDFQGQPEVEAESLHVAEQKVTWTIKNTGKSDVFLRVKVLEGFNLVDSGIEGDIEIRPDGQEWQEGEDGYYYYSDANPLRPGDSVDFSLQVNFDVWDTVASFPLDIEAEAIQASNDAMKYIW